MLWFMWLYNSTLKSKTPYALVHVAVQFYFKTFESFKIQCWSDAGIKQWTPNPVVRFWSPVLSHLSLHLDCFLWSFPCHADPEIRTHRRTYESSPSANPSHEAHQQHQQQQPPQPLRSTFKGSCLSLYQQQRLLLPLLLLLLLLPLHYHY